MKLVSTSKKSLCAVIATLFLLSTSILEFYIQSVIAESDDITVPDNYTKIQWAIGNASAGGTIFVRNGTYYEHLNINKPLTLIGESRKGTIIDGSEENRTIIEVAASNVVISGFTVQNSSRVAGTSYAGIKVSRSACNITSNIVTKTRIGIFVTSQNSRVAENTVMKNGQGIVLYSSSEVIVEANNVSVNTVGISLALSFNNIILNNRAFNSSTGGHGIIIQSSSFNNTIRENELFNNYHGMWLSNSYNNLILENIIANNKLLGIELSGSSDNIFYHNNFINNGLPPYAPSIKHIVIDISSTNNWDDGYPSGGNYWYDYIDVDERSGLNQDQPGSDEIWDNPYVINANNRDNYPSVRSYDDISHLILDETESIADAGPNQTVKVGTIVTFNASGSTGNIINYQWDFGDGTTEAGVISDHTYNRTGTYTVTLTVRDAAGNIATDRLTVTVIADNVSSIGNPFLWISALTGVVAIVMMAAFFWKRRHRSKRKTLLRKHRLLSKHSLLWMAGTPKNRSKWLCRFADFR